MDNHGKEKGEGAMPSDEPTSEARPAATIYSSGWRRHWGKLTTAAIALAAFLGWYDTVRNLYVGTWINSMSTQIITYKGSADPKGKVFRMYGEMDESMINVIGRHVKYVSRIVDKNTHVFEIYDLHAGDDYKVMEITYKRKK